jgi:hypothetical protein
MSARRLNEPVPIAVRAAHRAEHAGEIPTHLQLGPRKRWRPVAQVLETWDVDDYWWTDQPVCRRYFTCQTDTGQVATVFHDAQTGGWYAQR